ncbi:MAG TPA: NUDIX hydrolase [Cellulomonas sp.]
MTGQVVPVVEAAGALVWRVRQGRLQVVLVHRPRYHDWSWPKGKLEPGEHAITAAAREVEEETGLTTVLGQPLPTLHYALADGRPKRVRYWAAQPAGRPDGAALHARPPAEHASKDEIDRTRWFDIEEAYRRLTRPDDRGPLDALVHAHEHGRLDTRALVVVRHGRARGRASWGREEATRPLTPAGKRQAEALVPVLSAFGVAAAVTSPWRRCRATMAPYLAAAGLTAEDCDELTEQQHAEAPAGAATVVTRLLGGTGDLAVCTHRPVLPTVVAVLGEHARRAAREQLPTVDPYLRPGDVLVAHVSTAADGTPRVEAVERHTPTVG